MSFFFSPSHLLYIRATHHLHPHLPQHLHISCLLLPPSLNGPGAWMYGGTASPEIALPTYLLPDPASPFTTTFHDEEEETILGHHHSSHPSTTTAKAQGGEFDGFGSDVEHQAQQASSSAESARKRWDLFSVRVHLGVFHAKKRLSNLKQGGSSVSSSSTSTASPTIPSSNPAGLRSPKLAPSFHVSSIQVTSFLEGRSRKDAYHTLRADFKDVDY
ncbi:uncharacterized protein EI90DRAFT_3126705 [Cantharellus anzutake]|uniref:uncharacterized protein n=1 Tax=Cantharellus anzutake TaxID=1750568 RepID=UPI00190686D3|nr:uncharacterized protein EI90DRAFT_3126705 [Cantharellus anzutake]KAF8327714.1 hypothetical protein EI90DRAFT_3126705 [Cantharellus anzutake]